MLMLTFAFLPLFFVPLVCKQNCNLPDAWGPGCTYCNFKPDPDGFLYLSDPFPSTSDNWNAFGSPSPRSQSKSFGGQTKEVLDTRGDSWCDSGVLSRNPFPLPFRLDVEFAFEISDPTRHFNDLKIGLHDGTTTREGVCRSEQPSWHVPMFVHQQKADGKVPLPVLRINLGRFAHVTSESNLSPLRLQPYQTDSQTILLAEGEAELMGESPYVNSWLVATLFVWKNGTSAVLLNGQFLMTVDFDPENLDVSSGMLHVVLGGRSSGGGGRNYLGRVVVSKFEETLCRSLDPVPPGEEPIPHSDFLGTTPRAVIWVVVILALLGTVCCFCCCVLLCAVVIVAALVWLGGRLGDAEQTLLQNSQDAELSDEEIDDEVPPGGLRDSVVVFGDAS